MGSRPPERDPRSWMAGGALAPKKRPPPDRVLGDILMEGLGIWATCRNCRHRASLSPLNLAKRLGYDQSVTALRRRLRCSKCGERQVEVRLVEAVAR